MHVTPIGPRVLIKPKKHEEKTKGGIFIPDTAKEERKEGEVISVGTTKEGKELPLKKGDKIIYGGYSSEKIKVDDEELVIIDFKDVLVKFG